MKRSDSFFADFRVQEFVLANRNGIGSIQQGIGSLKRRLIFITDRLELALAQPHYIVAAAGAMVMPCLGHQHPKEKAELRVLPCLGLPEYRAALGIEADGKQIENGLIAGLFDAGRIKVLGRQGTPVGDHDIAVILMLEIEHIAKRAKPVAQMKRAGGGGWIQKDVCDEFPKAMLLTG